MPGLDTPGPAAVTSRFVEPVPTGEVHPPMPDPARIVRKSIRLCERPGVPYELACLEVMAAAQRAIAALEVVGIREVWWLVEVRDEAARLQRARAYPEPTPIGSRHDSATAGSDRRHR